VRDKVQTHEDVLKLIKILYPGLNTVNWRILDKQSDLKGQRLILHTNRDYFVAIKRARYETFTGLSQGTVKVLKDPEAQYQEGELVPNTASAESVSEGEGDGQSTPSADCRRATGAKKVITPSIKSISADQGTLKKGTWSDNKEKTKEEGMERG
jgi:hypothetical protein